MSINVNRPIARPVARPVQVNAQPVSTAKKVEGVAAEVATTALGAIGGYAGLGTLGMKYGGEVIGPIFMLLGGAAGALAGGGVGAWLGNKLRKAIEN